MVYQVLFVGQIIFYLLAITGFMLENIKVKFGKGYPSWVATAEIRFVRDDLRDGARSARPKFDGAFAASAASVPPLPIPWMGWVLPQTSRNEALAAYLCAVVRPLSRR